MKSSAISLIYREDVNNLLKSKNNDIQLYFNLFQLEKDITSYDGINWDIGFQLINRLTCQLRLPDKSYRFSRTRRILFWS
jgi:hypothetical protein